jgi:hypothetical protein
MNIFKFAYDEICKCSSGGIFKEDLPEELRCEDGLKIMKHNCTRVQNINGRDCYLGLEKIHECRKKWNKSGNMESLQFMQPVRLMCP